MSQLRRDMANSKQAGVTWQVLGNTVVMGPLNSPDVESAAQRQGQVAETLLQVRPLQAGSDPAAGENMHEACMSAEPSLCYCQSC